MLYIYSSLKNSGGFSPIMHWQLLLIMMMVMAKLILANNNTVDQEEFEQPILTLTNAINKIDCGQHYLNETVGISTIGFDVYQIIYNHSANNLWIIVYPNRSADLSANYNHHHQSLWSLNLIDGYLFIFKEFTTNRLERMLMEQFKWKEQKEIEQKPEIRIIMGYTKMTGYIFDSYITYDRIEYRFGYYETIGGYNDVIIMKMNHTTIITLISSNCGQLFQLYYDQTTSQVSLYRRQKRQKLQLQIYLHTFYSRTKQGYYFSLNKDALSVDNRNSWYENQDKLFNNQWQYGFTMDSVVIEKNESEKILFLVSSDKILAVNELLLFDLKGEKMYNIHLMKFNDYFHCIWSKIMDINHVMNRTNRMGEYLKIIIFILTLIILLAVMISILIALYNYRRSLDQTTTTTTIDYYPNKYRLSETISLKTIDTIDTFVDRSKMKNNHHHQKINRISRNKK